MSHEKYEAEARRWMRQAFADLAAARSSIASGHCEWACFQCQQAGEKAVKALWYFSGHDPWGHSLQKLAQEHPDEEVCARLEAVVQETRDLDRLYIPTRYPNGLPELAPADAYTKVEAERAVCAAQAVLDLAAEITGLGP